MNLQIINTSDGFKTIYLPDLDEQYHSVNGAFTESNHVFLEMGYQFHKAVSPKVFEVGFGTGLNCLLTAIAAEKTKRNTKYISIEKFPLDESSIKQLNYGEKISLDAKILFEKIHACKWNETVQISKYFQLKKLKSDLIKNDISEIKNCDIIYFDAFGPDKQPEIWKPDIFQKIFISTARNGIFVTYSAKGEVRRQLTACGYKMERIPGPPGKIQMLRGIK